MAGTRFRLLAMVGVTLAGFVVARGLQPPHLMAAQQAPNFDNVEIRVLQVRENIHMLVGAGGNITVQTGPDGVLIVDSQFAPLSTKILTPRREEITIPNTVVVSTSVVNYARTNALLTTSVTIGLPATSKSSVISSDV